MHEVNLRREHDSDDFDSTAKTLFALSDIKWELLNFVKNNPGCDIATIVEQIGAPTPAVIQKHLKRLEVYGFIASQTGHAVKQTGEKRLLYSLAPRHIAAAMDSTRQIEEELTIKLDPQLVVRIQQLGNERKIRNQIICICTMLQDKALTQREILLGLRDYFTLKNLPTNHAEVLRQLVEAEILRRTISERKLGYIYQLPKS
ncbi:MAG: hypothetical protein O2840_00220 [bacterium]|nr:hypothetical protein [bacterium]